MDYRRAALLGLRNEPEADRMVLRHVGAHDDDAVSMRQAPELHCSRTASEGGTQTGDRSGVSYSRLVLDPHHAQPAAEEFLDEVVFLVIHRGAADGDDAQRLVHRRTV